MYASAFSLDPDRVFHTVPVRRLYYWLEARMDRMTRERDAQKDAEPGGNRSYNDADLAAVMAKDQAKRG